jgi:hypothetical protein
MHIQKSSVDAHRQLPPFGKPSIYTEFLDCEDDGAWYFCSGAFVAFGPRKRDSSCDG